LRIVLTIIAKACDRFFGTGILFDIIVVAIVKSPCILLTVSS
jgi:hypothetical protein